MRAWQLAAVLACVLIGVETPQVRAEDERPYQVREPKKFWMNKSVFQKRGIVVEDDDFIIRERYWVLDRSVTGQVTDVELADKDDVFLSVRFNSMGGGWRQQGVNIRDRVVSKTDRTVTVRPDSYGDGTKIDVDEVTFSYRIEGDEVDPRGCGLILRHEGPVVLVRFPGRLLSLESPRKGTPVVRSWDWHDGFADGGKKPQGRGEESWGDCIGIVLRERDDEGFLEIEWQKTKRRKSHRFDHFGYYDVEPVP